MAKGTINAADVSLRVQHDDNAEVIAGLAQGAVVDVLSSTADKTWLLVSTPISGQTRVGWVRAQSVTVEGAPPPPPPPPAAHEKILWVVNYASLDAFLAKAVSVGATGVAIRTDNDVAKAIPAVHAKGIKVYGWRWPSAKHDDCLAEANRAAALLGQGMDGYFVDPEGAPGKPFDWDQNGLEQLAEDFCRTITAAGPGKPFGTTSHYRAKAVFPRLPWTSFFKFSTVLLPQAYWRSTQGTIGHGPVQNYKTSIDAWAAAGGDRAKIVPMAGELGSSTGAEVDAYANEAAAEKIPTLHFYTFETSVKNDVWDAVTKA